MNILVFNYEYPPIGGGGGVICKDISEEWVKMGNRVTVITSLYSNLKEEEDVNGVEIFRVKVFNRKKQDVASLPSMLSYLPASIKKAKQLLKRNRYDVINTHFAIPTGPAGQYIASKYNIPNVLSIHGGDIYDPSKSLSPHKTPVLNQIVKTVLRKAEKVVAQSSDTKGNALNFYRVKREIEIIPLGIKPNHFPIIDRPSLNLPNDKIIFCTIGRLVKRKNLPELLEILRSVNDQIPCELLIIGDGPEYSALKEIINQKCIEKNVQLLGRVSEEEKFQYLSASDIYLSTAMHEGFGIVFLEAMECGLPVVCYNKGGQVDFLKNGETGFLVQLGDKKTFEKKLLELINNQELMKKISDNNKSYVKSYHISNIASKYLSLFNKVIDKEKMN